MKCKSIVGTVIMALLITTTNATVWYVHPDSAQNCIQDCLDSCAVNDTVLVGQGIYYENLVWPNTQGIHLIGELGPEHTIVDGDHSGTVIRIETAVDTSTMIQGFTVQNGYLGGIWCRNHSSPIITSNIIINNEHGTGGGILCDTVCSPIISNNTVTGNTAFHYQCGTGGGITCRGPSEAVIRYNTITNNTATGSWGIGGGIYCAWGYNGIITGNTIMGNNASAGGGIACRESSPTISNNLINGNIALEGGGINCSGSSPSINTCIIVNNDKDGIYCELGQFNPSYPMISDNDIYDNIGFGVQNLDTNWIDAEYNWWGDSTGPYHPNSNPGGLGDSVSDYIDFIPWLYWPGVEEKPTTNPVIKYNAIGRTIFAGALQLPEDKKCKVYDITGRVVNPDRMQPGIYFIEIDGAGTQKVIKVK